MIAPVAGTPFDFRPERQPLGRCGPAIETVPPAAPAGTHRGIDHTYLIRGWQPDGRLRTGALLRDPASGRRLEELQARLSSQGVQWIGVMSNPQDSIQDIRNFAEYKTW